MCTRAHLQILGSAGWWGHRSQGVPVPAAQLHELPLFGSVFVQLQRRSLQEGRSSPGSPVLLFDAAYLECHKQLVEQSSWICSVEQFYCFFITCCCVPSSPTDVTMPNSISSWLSFILQNSYVYWLGWITCRNTVNKVYKFSSSYQYLKYCSYFSNESLYPCLTTTFIVIVPNRFCFLVCSQF